MPDLTESNVYSPNQIAVRTMPNGGKSWDVLHGTLATGEVISVHESTQPAGTPPNAPHKVAHSEFIFVREGTLDFQHDGITDRVSPGGILFVAPGSLQTVRNVGDGPANYLVVAIGGDTK